MPAEHVLSRRHQTKAKAARLLLSLLLLLLLLLPVVAVLDEPAGAPHFPLHLSGVKLPSHPSHQPEVLREEPGDGPLWVGATLVVAVALAAQVAVLHDRSMHLHRPCSTSVVSSVAGEELVVARQAARGCHKKQEAATTELHSQFSSLSSGQFTILHLSQTRPHLTNSLPNLSVSSL